ncbi:circularly permuted type 2 ATP-grasp protein [Rhodopirellula sp. JC740]|uniref:Circularly permuted type 2 ATP-grasp protein n=1 Tax=Rhodopirellula halodulae TaxID=2894198 RepID=A0ABS8NH58_9BACT|nr:circularly permuted type 2 ATP-grasp protein [Rhodopirellula sp. JC740]MCC9641816.1 circularly permuted type 2 ATP-grasp protein [Rhodopirellula sp. JC740]
MIVDRLRDHRATVLSSPLPSQKNVPITTATAASDPSPTPPTPPLSLADYAAKANRFDECRSAQGSLRTCWKSIADEVASLGQSGLNDRESQIEQLIRENGSTFQVDTGEGTQTRPWQLATVPIAIAEQDWGRLASGLTQRTRVLEAVLADLLGPQRLLRERVLPPELVWDNPRFLRVYHNLPVSAGHRLHLTGFDVARANDGGWWVTGDRTRAPSGLGYLLENRIVHGRVFPHLSRTANVRRLASFFGVMRSHFRSLAPHQNNNPRVALLTPGQGSYRDFEDAYLARYLGYTLVQGRDLAVRGERLHLKTLGGLLPIEVLWRHVSDRKCDPLELDPQSSEGVTGLLRCKRGGQLAVVNSIGSVITEMPALIPFLPAAAKLLLGENLQLPSVATYWCGAAKERQYVLDHLDELVVRDAFAVNDTRPVIPENCTADEKHALIQQIKAEPNRFVGQQRLSHSVTPVWHQERFEPWHVSLRTFVLQTNNSVEVLPGALARVSPNEDLLSNSPVQGQLSQDCWIVSEKPVDHETTLLKTDHSTIVLRRSGAELPSRVAEHLFWLGRYVERCESIARLLRTTLARLAGEDDLSELPEMSRLVAALAAVGQLEPDYVIEGLDGAMPQLDSVLPSSVLDTSHPRALQSAILSALSNATAVRDRISLDAYRIFQSVHADLAGTKRNVTPNVSRALERLNRLITHLLAFSGLTAESLTRTHGWRFLLLGRRLERADQTAELLLATMTRPIADEVGMCEAILDATDSLMTYRSRYLSLLRPAPTIDLLVTDETNPRSLRFQLNDIQQLLYDLPTDPGRVALGADERLARELQHPLLIADVATLTEVNSSGKRAQLQQLLELVQEKIPLLANAIAGRYLIHTAPEQTLTGDREQTLDEPLLPPDESQG